MLTQDLNNTLEAFEKDLAIAIKKLLIKKKVDEDSNLVKSVSVEFDEQKDIFNIIANDYFYYVSEGRKPKARKVPIADLIDWIKRKNIPTRGNTINQTAFAIQQAIYKNGIKGKKYVDTTIDITTDMVNDYTIDQLVKMIVDDIVKTFD